MEPIVEVILESPEQQNEQLRMAALPRIRMAMRRLSWLVQRAKVKFSGVDNAQGGIDKRCEVELTSENGEPVVIVSVARDWMSALHSALGRASKALLRRLQHESEHRRDMQGPPRLLPLRAGAI